VAVSLSSPDPDVTVLTETQSYKTIKVGATKSKKFKIFLSRDYDTDKPVQLVAEATFVGILSPTTWHRFVQTGQPSGIGTQFSFTAANHPIPDDDPAGVNLPFSISGVGYASDMTFSFDGDTCTTDPGATTNGIDHTWVGDLVAKLTSPAGDTITLFSRPGSGLNSGNNICQAVFDDTATTPFTSLAPADAPFTGSWLPDQPLAGLLGASMDGTWTLNVADLALADTGDVNDFTVTFYGFVG
jgi:subtilisin-like proprotein convertase family protein